MSIPITMPRLSDTMEEGTLVKWRVKVGDAVKSGDRVLLVDDQLATGGTMQACVKLAEQSGAVVVGCAFVIELTFLGGRAKLAPHEAYSLIRYDGEGSAADTDNT